MIRTRTTKRTTRSHPLDAYLPLVASDEPVDDGSLPVLEVSEAAMLVAIAREPRMGRFLLGRLSDTVALVDPGAEDALMTALRAAGHTPKIVAGRSS